MHHLVCTGNIVTKQMEDYLRGLAPSVHIVRGDEDSIDTFPSLPDIKVIKIGEFKLGLTHGHSIIPTGNVDSLSALARQLDTDLLIYGHTHKPDFTEHHGKYFLSPGSITGSYTDVQGGAEVPSFMLLMLTGKKAMCYIYQIDEAGNVSVSRSEFSKE